MDKADRKWEPFFQQTDGQSGAVQNLAVKNLLPVLRDKSLHANAHSQHRAFLNPCILQQFQNGLAQHIEICVLLGKDQGDETTGSDTMAFQADVTDPGQVKDMVAAVTGKYQKLDAAFCNAGICIRYRHVHHNSLIENIKAMTGQAWLVMIFNFLYFALYVVRSTTVIYFFKYNLQREDLATLVGFLGILSGLPMLLCLPKLEEMFGKRNILFLSVAIYLAGNILILIDQTSVVFQLTGLVITGLGIYGIFGTIFAMQPDAIDYSEWKKNRSISGTIAAFQGLFVKASMGLASWIIGLYLGMNGYNGELSTQSAAAQQSIQFCYMWIPVILCVLLAGANMFWKLDSCADEMRAELNERRKKLQELIEKW